MAIIFKEEDHIYESIDENLEKDNITWTSVTSFIGKFKPKFDAKKQAIKPIVDANGIKIAPEQKLNPGVYPEHFAYLKSAAICGQADLVTIVNGKVHITDYKTNKEIKEKGFTNWEGITSKMYKPLSHLDDCNLNHYNLQLSIYMYIILKHNPKLKPGKLVIQHVSFEKEGENAHGYPITKYDDQGEPIIKEIKIYDLPYMKEEVRSLIMWLKDNK